MITNFLKKKIPIPAHHPFLHVLFLFTSYSYPVFFFLDMQPTLFSLSIHQNLHFLFQRETTSFFRSTILDFFKKWRVYFIFLVFVSRFYLILSLKRKKKFASTLFPTNPKVWTSVSSRLGRFNVILLCI